MASLYPIKQKKKEKKREINIPPHFCLSLALYFYTSLTLKSPIEYTKCFILLLFCCVFLFGFTAIKCSSWLNYQRWRPSDSTAATAASASCRRWWWTGLDQARFSGRSGPDGQHTHPRSSSKVPEVRIDKHEVLLLQQLQPLSAAPLLQDLPEVLDSRRGPEERSGGRWLP